MRRLLCWLLGHKPPDGGSPKQRFYFCERCRFVVVFGRHR